MKKPKHFCLLLVTSLPFLLLAQTIPQLRLKLGVTKTFASPFVSDGYAYKAGAVASPYPVLGVEFSHPIKHAYRYWFAGVSLDIQGFSSVPNLKNFQSFQAQGSLQVVSGTFRFYAGIEQRIARKQIPANRNYISIFGGLGLTLNSFGGAGEGPISTTGSEGITKDGRQFKSPYITGYYFADYQTAVYIRRSSLFSPTLFTGFRWHVRNKKGNEVIISELLANYGLTRYYNYYMPYTLNNEPHTDKLGEKGVCIQLNTMIPLLHFGKKK